MNEATKDRGGALRLLHEGFDSAAIEFDKVDFVEMYDLATDPWQQKNIEKGSPAAKKAALKKELHRWYECKGDACP